MPSASARAMEDLTACQMCCAVLCNCVRVPASHVAYQKYLYPHHRKAGDPSVHVHTSRR